MLIRFPKTNMDLVRGRHTGQLGESGTLQLVDDYDNGVITAANLPINTSQKSAPSQSTNSTTVTNGNGTTNSNNRPTSGKGVFTHSRAFTLSSDNSMGNPVLEHSTFSSDLEQAEDEDYDDFVETEGVHYSADKKYNNQLDYYSNNPHSKNVSRKRTNPKTRNSGRSEETDCTNNTLDSAYVFSSSSNTTNIASEDYHEEIIKARKKDAVDHLVASQYIYTDMDCTENSNFEGQHEKPEKSRKSMAMPGGKGGPADSRAAMEAKAKKEALRKKKKKKQAKKAMKQCRFLIGMVCIAAGVYFVFIKAPQVDTEIFEAEEEPRRHHHHKHHFWNENAAPVIDIWNNYMGIFGLQIAGGSEAGGEA